MKGIKMKKEIAEKLRPVTSHFMGIAIERALQGKSGMDEVVFAEVHDSLQAKIKETLTPEEILSVATDAIGKYCAELGLSVMSTLEQSTS